MLVKVYRFLERDRSELMLEAVTSLISTCLDAQGQDGIPVDSGHRWIGRFERGLGASRPIGRTPVQDAVVTGVRHRTAHAHPATAYRGIEPAAATRIPGDAAGGGHIAGVNDLRAPQPA